MENIYSVRLEPKCVLVQLEYYFVFIFFPRFTWAALLCTTVYIHRVCFVTVSLEDGVVLFSTNHLILLQ